MIDGSGYYIQYFTKISLTKQEEVAEARTVWLGAHAARGGYGGCDSLGSASTLRVVILTVYTLNPID